MAAMNVEKMGLKELVNLQARIQSAIVTARAKERSEIKNKAAELAASHGFSLAELFGGRAAKAKKAVGAAKYANPDDRTDTWTGRGRRPSWLVARLKKGAKLSDFAI